MKWYPELSLKITTYLHIENASENNILFFIKSFYKKYNEAEILLFFKLAADIINKYPNKYSDHVKDMILNKKIPDGIILKCDKSDIDSLDEDYCDGMFTHYVDRILDRMKK